MSMRWLISVPVWGERCVNVFCATALPALELAVLELHQQYGFDVRVVVHTDQPQRVQQSASQIRIEPRPVPAGLRDFDCLSQSHREVLNIACRDDIVVLLTADLVISMKGLAYCAGVFNNPQKKLVMCAGVRALQEGHISSTNNAAQFMRWAWDNRHPMTEACRWPDGNSPDLSRVYFEGQEGEVVCRLCLPHPLAVRIDGRTLGFTPTIDNNLMQGFEQSEIHLTCNSDKLSLVELSPRDKDFTKTNSPMGERLAKSGVAVPDPLQRWCMNHRIVLCGTGQNCDDEQFMALVR